MLFLAICMNKLQRKMCWSADLQLHVILLAQPIKIFGVLNVMVTVPCSLFRCVPLFMGNAVYLSGASKLPYPPVGGCRCLQNVGSDVSCCIVLCRRRMTLQHFRVSVLRPACMALCLDIVSLLYVV